VGQGSEGGASSGVSRSDQRRYYVHTSPDAHIPLESLQNGIAAHWIEIVGILIQAFPLGCDAC
jgi:hypothetical protein